MKKISFFACALSAMLIGFSACSEEERKIDNGGQGQGGGNGSSVEEKGTHFDIWVSLGESTGMGSDGATCLVKSVDSLTVQEPINFKNDGVDVTATIYQESVIKDGYYYQVPKSADRFGKYRIADNRLETLAEHPFEQNTYKDRRYTHAWTDDNTLVIMAANGSADKVIWTKLNAADMSIMAEGQIQHIGACQVQGVGQYDNICFPAQERDGAFLCGIHRCGRHECGERGHGRQGRPDGRNGIRGTVARQDVFR